MLSDAGHRSATQFNIIISNSLADTLYRIQMRVVRSINSIEYEYVKRRDFEGRLSILRPCILLNISTNLLRSCAARLTPSDYNIKLVVRNATRAESGTYTLTATNENGTDSADVLVTILGTSGSRGDRDQHSAGRINT